MPILSSAYPLVAWYSKLLLDLSSLIVQFLFGMTIFLEVAGFSVASFGLFKDWRI